MRFFAGWTQPGRDRELYMAEAPGDAFYATKKGRNSGRIAITALDRDGIRQRDVSTNLCGRWLPPRISIR
jgi:hypothetical protein